MTVASNGSDYATGTNYPLLTISNAVHIATTNGLTNTIQLIGPQLLSFTTPTFGSNISLNGQSANSTFITYDGASDFIISGDNVILSKFSMIGSTTNSSLPLVVVKGTNTSLDGLNIFGATDGINADGNTINSAVNVTIKNSLFIGRYDLMCLEGSGAGTNSVFTLQNGISKINSTVNPTRGCIVSNLTVIFDDWHFNITNTSANHTYGIFVRNGGVARVGNHTTFNITNSNYTYGTSNCCGVYLEAGGKLYIDPTFDTNDLYNANGGLTNVFPQNITGANISAMDLPSPNSNLPTSSAPCHNPCCRPPSSPTTNPHLSRTIQTK